MNCRTLIGTIGMLLVLAIGTHASARHSSLDGQLRISNQRSETGRVFIDGEFQALIPARSQRVIGNVPNGIRLVEFRVPDRQTTVKQVAVAVQKTARIRFEPVLGSARILNDSGIPMRLKVDGVKLGRINPNTVRILEHLTPGRHRIVMRPAKGFITSQGTSYATGHVDSNLVPNAHNRLVQTFVVAAGKETSVAVGKYFASLRVSNPFARRVAVRVDGRRVGTVEPFGTRMFEDILPGIRTIELGKRFGKHAKTLVSEQLNLAPGESSIWTPKPLHNGSLTLRNQWGVPVKVQLNDAMVGVLQPGETRTFRNLASGKYRVTSLHPWIGGVTRIVRVPVGRHMRVAIGRPVPPPSQAMFRSHSLHGKPAGWEF